MKMTSTIIIKQGRWDKYYQIKTVLENGRTFIDCEHFDTRWAALIKIDEIHNDMIASIKAGLL